MTIRTLLVDDFDDWRRTVRQMLQGRPQLQIIGEASDGLEAVQKAGELRPDLILLDIGLPTLNGIEAARQMRQVSPNSKILFLSQDNSLDPEELALSTGAQGYVHKARVQRDLLPVIDAVLRGEQFVSRDLRRCGFAEISSEKAPHLHEVLFYSDDTVFLENSARLVAVAVNAGDVAIVLATESHRKSLAQRLKAQGLDADAAAQQGTYIPLDAAKMLSTFMVNDMPDSARFFELAGGLIEAVAKAAKREPRRVVVCGECAPLLWADGKEDAAIRLEQLWDQLVTRYKVDTLCGYASSSFHGAEDEHAFNSICAEHSRVKSQ